MKKIVKDFLSPGYFFLLISPNLNSSVEERNTKYREKAPQKEEKNKEKHLTMEKENVLE